MIDIALPHNQTKVEMNRARERQRSLNRTAVALTRRENRTAKTPAKPYCLCKIPTYPCWWENMELRQRGILYLLRLAPLTRQGVDGGVEWTTTGSGLYIPGPESAYEGRYLAKYGSTTHEAREIIVAKAGVLHFPDENELEPTFELAIVGIPNNLLLGMECALRNYIGREGFRLRWHARDDKPIPGNANAYTEQFELVYEEGNCRRLSTICQTLAERLELARQDAIDEIERAFLSRQRDITARRSKFRSDQRREFYRTRTQLLHAEELEGIRQRLRGYPEDVVQASLDSLRVSRESTLQTMKTRHQEEIVRLEAETPEVDVDEIFKEHLTAAGQMH